MNEMFQKVFAGVVECNASQATSEVETMLGAGIKAEDILREGLIPAMDEVGRLFEQGEYYIPEMLAAARAMQAGLTLLKPQLKQADVKSTGKVAIGTVKGDLHDIGKNLVALMLEGAGFEVRDLGTDVAPEEFVQAVQDNSMDILALSALLTTTMPNIKNTIQALNAAGLRDRVKIVIGGAPITQEYADLVGADGYAADASRAVGLIKSLL